MNAQTNDRIGRQVHAPVRGNARQRDDLDTELALEDVHPRAVSTTWHWRHGLGAPHTVGATS